MAMSERYPKQSILVDVDGDGVLHYESDQNGVVAYRPCPPELIAVILDNEKLSVSEEEYAPADVESKDYKERLHVSPKIVRSVAKAALFCATLSAAYVGADMYMTQTASGGHVQIDVGQGLDNLQSNITFPLRMAAGR